jgi:hypothetical protein
LARLHQKSDDKRDRRVRYGLDLHIAIPPPSYSHCIPTRQCYSQSFIMTTS